MHIRMFIINFAKLTFASTIGLHKVLQTLRLYDATRSLVRCILHAQGNNNSSRGT